MPYFKEGTFELYHGDCCDVLPTIHDIDMVFADPPYFLSNGGLTINSGKIVSVNKGDWDSRTGDIDDFNYKWIKAVRDSLKPSGTVWICGTMHNIFSIVKVLEELGFKILNTITWQKKNPPPNFSCRFFTHSTEFIIWARKSEKVGHYFNYDLMRVLNGGKQMKDVWTFSAIGRWEKQCGKHPTQKPLSVVSRAVLASTKFGDRILDPFCGSSTTGIAASIFGREYIGIDTESEYLELSKRRYDELVKNGSGYYIKKIEGLIKGIDYLKPDSKCI